ncbi:hypothetical protein HY500_03670 [Candidatus Woesearchaeota archaeon]|nr:hypothetical protein [Candidatus Woesearchaeota archaeon]
MVYIHKLNQLTPKIADIESVPIIRIIKKDFSLPVKEEVIKKYFSPYFVQEQDIEAMKNSLNIIQPTLEEFKELLEKKDPDYASVNITRAYKLVSEVQEPLLLNTHYAEGIFTWQEEFVKEATLIFNSLPGARSHEKKIELNNKLNVLFQKILRNREFTFAYQDIIHEAEFEHIASLKNMISDGFLFYIKMEEELNKINFNSIKKRIPLDKLRHSESLEKSVSGIKNGVDKAYHINMSMINWAVLFYSYVKFLKGS